MGWCSYRIAFVLICAIFLNTSKEYNYIQELTLLLLDCYGICPCSGVGVPDLNIPEKLGALYRFNLPGIWEDTWDPEGILSTLRQLQLVLWV